MKSNISSIATDIHRHSAISDPTPAPVEPPPWSTNWLAPIAAKSSICKSLNWQEGAEDQIVELEPEQGTRPLYIRLSPRDSALEPRRLAGRCDPVTYCILPAIIVWILPCRSRSEQTLKRWLSVPDFPLPQVPVNLHGHPLRQVIARAAKLLLLPRLHHKMVVIRARRQGGHRARALLLSSRRIRSGSGQPRSS